MSTVLVGEIPVEEFALEQTFDQLPAVAFECERVVDHADDVRMPLLWARDAPGRHVHRSLERDDSTESVTALADFGDQQLFRVTWSAEVRDALSLLTESAGSLLDVRGDGTGWQVRIFYPNRKSVSIVDGCDDISFAMNRVGRLEQKSAVRYGLTDKQHEALRVGWNRGYFDVPRQIGIKELSGDLGVTHQAVSERLRRGEATLIKETLGLHEPGEEARLQH